MSASYSITPTAYQSLAGSARSAACSGAMYAGVPARTSSAVSPTGLSILTAHETEVEDREPAIRCHQHVRRLQIAVELPLVVYGAHAERELPQRVAHEPFGEHGVRTDVLEEGAAGHEVHREEPLLAVGEEVVQSNEVGMLHAGKRAKLVFEPVDAHRVEPGQRLEQE